ncbi:MAG: hypothetical protein ACJ8R9_18250 [Steroidobacteraceae bacterium]
MSCYEWTFVREPVVRRPQVVIPGYWMRRLSAAGRTVAHAATLAIASLVINSTVVCSSSAQSWGLPPPVYSLKDGNGVDLVSFRLYLQQTDVSIGSREHPLTHTIMSYSDGDWLSSGIFATNGIDQDARQRFLGKDSSRAGVSGWPGPGNCEHSSGDPAGGITVTVGTVTEDFTCVGGDIVPAAPSGSTLTYNSDQTFTYTNGDGEQTLLGLVTPLAQTRYPDGRVLTWWFNDDGTGAPLLKSITRSDGLQLKYTYTKLASGLWSTTSVTMINNAYEYCNPTASTCSLGMMWPTVNYSFTQSASGAVFTVTDAAGRVTRYTEDNVPWNTTPTSWGRTVGIKLPSSASADNITYTYCDNRNIWCTNFGTVGWLPWTYKNYVVAVTRDGQAWSYSGAPGSPSGSQCGNATYGFTNPVGASKQAALLDCPTNGPSLPRYVISPFLQLTDESGAKFNANPNGVGIQNAIKPEGNRANYAYDERGNLTQETLVPKSGSPLAQVNLYANYDATCTNRFTCNKPNWVKDGKGNQTDYKYDPNHGGVVKVTLPPDADGIRPETRYAYTQRYAWVMNSSGNGYVQSAAPIWVPAAESYCRKGAAASSGTGCALAGDEVITTYEYGSNSGPNNLFLKGVAVTADGVTHRACYSYDRYGNRISETKPAAGLTSCP